MIAFSIGQADKKEETSLMVLDVLYIHPAKQKVGARCHKYVLSVPYLFMPGVTTGLIHLLRGQGLRVEGLKLPQIRRYHPNELLRMHNMCHTLDPPSPMSLVPDEYGIEADMHRFTGYYHYCQRTAYARPGIGRGGWRG